MLLCQQTETDLTSETSGILENLKDGQSKKKGGNCVRELYTIFKTL
jgi:hypothetical protein